MPAGAKTRKKRLRKGEAVGMGDVPLYGLANLKNKLPVGEVRFR